MSQRTAGSSMLPASCQWAGAWPGRSATDVPMLEAVGRPHAVNPDRDLREIAEERGWPILAFQRQVSIGSRLTRPVPLISGATVTAALGAGAVWLLLKQRRRG